MIVPYWSTLRRSQIQRARNRGRQWCGGPRERAIRRGWKERSIHPQDLPFGKVRFPLAKTEHDRTVLTLPCSKVPGWFAAIAPADALKVDEKAWNAFPSCKTRLTVRSLFFPINESCSSGCSHSLPCSICRTAGWVNDSATLWIRSILITTAESKIM